MLAIQGVVQQFYGSRHAGGGKWVQTVHVVSASDPDPLQIPLPGVVLPDGVVNVALNGLGLNPVTEFGTTLQDGVSTLTVHVPRAELVSGDTFAVTAQLAS